MKDSTIGKPTSEQNDFAFTARLDQPVFMLVHDEAFSPPSHIIGRLVYEGKGMGLDRDENLEHILWQIKQRIRCYVFAAGYDDGTLLYLDDLKDGYGTYKSLNVGTEKIEEYLSHLRKIPETAQFAGWPEQIYYYHYFWKTEEGKQQRLSCFGAKSEHVVMAFDGDYQIESIELTPTHIPKMTDDIRSTQFENTESAWKSTTLKLLMMIHEQL